jgi:hypothetical protein
MNTRDFDWMRVEAACKDAIPVDCRKVARFGIYTLVCFERTGAPLAP